MTKTITVVTGSVRPNNVSEEILPLVLDELGKRDDVTVKVANLREMNLPFIDTPASPASDAFDPTQHDSVKQWFDTITETDSVIVLSPEYNRFPSPVLTNAISWIHKPWAGKKVVIMPYGSAGGVYAGTLLQRLFTVVGARTEYVLYSLIIGKDLNWGGGIADEAAVRKQINAAIDAATK